MKTPAIGTRPRITDIQTNHGSSIRLRASLYTQYANASQKITSARTRRFWIRSQAGEWKKLFTPPKKPRIWKAITGVVCLSHSPLQTRRRARSGSETPARRTVLPGIAYSSPGAVLLCAGEIREEVERAGHEQPAAVRTSAGEGCDGVDDGLHFGEVSARAHAELSRRERAPARGLGRDEARAERRELTEHGVDVLVGADACEDRPRPRLELTDEVADAVRVVRAGAQLVVPAPLEPAGHGHVALQVQRAPREGG